MENNEDFAALLKDGNDAMASAFVKKYYGRTIEFDGYCWDWMNHTSWSPFTGKETVYKTLFDSCIWVGDVEDVETNTAGPTFRVENVRYPNFTTVLNRKNVHVIAKVGIYDEDKQFIMLSYDSIEYR